MKVKKSHVNINISLLILVLSLTVAGALIQSFKPQYKLETPKSSAGEITLITPENRTYSEPDDGYYPGTYGFDNDLPGTEPDGWRVRQPDGSGYIAIDAIHAEHRNVLELRKTGGTDKASTGVTFPHNGTAGTFEYWLYKDTDSGIDPTRMNAPGFGGSIQFGIQSGDLYRGEWASRIIIASNAFTKDEWHHIRVDFDVAIGWQIQIDDIWYGSGYSLPFEDTPAYLTGFGFSSIFSGDHPNYGAWLDALDYSWHEEYTIGDNLNEGLLLSYDNTTNLDWQGYSLNGQSNKTILGNATIPMPADGLHQLKVFGNNTLGTYFESNVRYFTVDKSHSIFIQTPEAKTYTEPMSGYYPGTYGFENDQDGSIPYGWTQEGGGNGYVKVLSDPFYDNEHKKIVLVQELDTNQRSKNTFIDSQTNGTLEFWVQYGAFLPYIPGHHPKIGDIMIYESSDAEGIYLRMEEGDLKYYASGGWNSIQTVTQDTWYHFRIEFESGSSLYEGLGADKWHLYVNGTKMSGTGFNYKGSNSAMNKLEFYVYSPGYYHLLFDAVGYSWDSGYTIGDNLNEGLLLSYDNTTNLDWEGYSLDGQTNKTIMGNTTIPMPFDGGHNIQVFGNDSLGNMCESDIRYFDVDMVPIDISIISPTPYDLYQNIAPSFEIDIDDPDLNSTWYSLDGGITNIPFLGFTGTIEQSEWNKFSNGTVTIGFYANDSVNHISYASVTVRKDVLGPIITVSSPQVNEVFGVIAPYYDLSIVEHNLDSIWYSFDYGVTVFPLFSLTGTLDQAEWETKGGGTVPIRFYANDSLGHESFTDVTIIKDLTLPLITINSPGAGEVFGDSPPDYDISIIESNLDSYWYTIDSGATNISISSLSGTIDQTEWDKLGNGTVTIRFYAEDEGGNKGFAEIIVRKDINIPLITINSPITSDLLGLQPPQYDISVVEPNIDAMWYTLDSGTSNVTFSSLTGTIDQTEWNKFGDGIVNIRFYIKDEGGNEAFAEVSVNKDLIAPIVTINEPELGDIFVDYPPIYSISIDEIHSYVFWYSLDGGVHNYSIIELTGAISQASWDAIPNGHVTLRFYAEDEAGNIGQSSITITKRSTQEPIPPGIPGYNIIALIGVTLGVTLILTKRKLKK